MRRKTSWRIVVEAGRKGYARDFSQIRERGPQISDPFKVAQLIGFVGFTSSVLPGNGIPIRSPWESARAARRAFCRHKPPSQGVRGIGATECPLRTRRFLARHSSDHFSDLSWLCNLHALMPTIPARTTSSCPGSAGCPTSSPPRAAVALRPASTPTPIGKTADHPRPPADLTHQTFQHIVRLQAPPVLTRKRQAVRLRGAATLQGDALRGVRQTKASATARPSISVQ
jgi:hypothetical protein